jgi:hypothetical protein
MKCREYAPDFKIRLPWNIVAFVDPELRCRNCGRKEPALGLEGSLQFLHQQRVVVPISISTVACIINILQSKKTIVSGACTINIINDGSGSVNDASRSIMADGGFENKQNFKKVYKSSPSQLFYLKDRRRNSFKI